MRGQHPLVIGAMAAALASAIGLLGEGSGNREKARPAGEKFEAAPAVMPCGPRSIPEGAACIDLPKDDRHKGAPASRRPRMTESIPRRPDRPESAEQLVLPLPTPAQVDFGFGIENEPRDEATKQSEVAVDLGAARGAEVGAVELEGQNEPTEVVASGELFGHTVVTLHRVEEAGQKRQYLVFYGRLDAVGANIVEGGKLDAGDQIGFAGDSGTPGYVHLHLEARQVRDDLDVYPLEISRLIDQSVAIPTDLRNVLKKR